MYFDSVCWSLPVRFLPWFSALRDTACFFCWHFFRHRLPACVAGLRSFDTAGAIVVF